MPLFMCSKCGSVDNTATSGYWAQQANAYVAGVPLTPKCSACNPEIGAWHNQFPRRRAEGFKQDRRGFIYSPDEIEKFGQLGPFTDVVLPAAGEGA
jgi:hypothetical protein